MSQIEFPQGVDPVAIVAGFCGSLVSSLLDWKGIKEGVRKILIGSLSATFLTPAIQPFLSGMLHPLGMTGDASTGLSGFICGLTGLLIVDAIARAVKVKLDAVEDRDEADH